MPIYTNLTDRICRSRGESKTPSELSRLKLHYMLSNPACEEAGTATSNYIIPYTRLGSQFLLSRSEMRLEHVICFKKGWCLVHGIGEFKLDKTYIEGTFI